MSDYQRNCPRCGSPNTNVQMMAKTHYKEGHGCLFTFLFGIFYWIWLIIKWVLKFTVAICWYALSIIIVPLKWFFLLISNSRGKISARDWTPEWLRKLMRRKGVVYTDYGSMWLCQNCGNTWKGN